MIFGPFWVILRVHDVTKVVKISKVSISGFIAGFSSQKTYPCTFLDPNYHFIEFSGVFITWSDHFLHFFLTTILWEFHKIIGFLVFQPQNVRNMMKHLTLIFKNHIKQVGISPITSVHYITQYTHTQTCRRNSVIGFIFL